MALPDLATTADLSDRGVELVPTVHDTMLTVASSLVREAAGSPILEAESTVTLTAWGETVLRLPGLPVTAVTTVEVDGDTVTGWTLVDGCGLWARNGWGCSAEPATVSVTYTHGLAEVPAHIVQLVCDLAILGANTAAAGAVDPRVVAESIDDYRVTFSDAGSAVASAMTLPAAVRMSLARQFGGSAGVVGSR